MVYGEHPVKKGFDPFFFVWPFQEFESDAMNEYPQSRGVFPFKNFFAEFPVKIDWFPERQYFEIVG